MKRSRFFCGRLVGSAIVVAAVACGGETSDDHGGSTHFQCNADVECVEHPELGDGWECKAGICHQTHAATSGSGAGGGNAGGPGLPVGDAYASGWIEEWGPGSSLGTRPPIEGVNVCVLGRDDLCTATDTNGLFNLNGLPENTELALTFSADGYMGAVVPIVTGTARFPVNAELVPIAAVDQWVADYGMSGFDTTKGLMIDVREPAGQSTIDPASGEGSFYLDDGELVFFNVDPDTYTLSTTTPGEPCADWPYGWPTGDPLAVRGPVIAGHATYVNWPCASSEGSGDAGSQ